MKDLYEKIAYLKGLTEGMDKKTNKNIVKSNELIIDILEDLIVVSDTYENLEDYVRYVDGDLEVLESQLYNDYEDFDDYLDENEIYDDYYDDEESKDESKDDFE